jgi:XRE family transcriptional regulator, regulator of sulfur utilization
MKLGERLRELRQQQGLTLLQLSQQTSLSVSYLSDLERGRTNPSIDTLERIANSYKMLLGELVAGADGWQMNPQQGLDPGLQELLEKGAINLATAQDLSRIELRGKRPQTADEWQELYLHLNTLMKPYLTQDETGSGGQ